MRIIGAILLTLFFIMLAIILALRVTLTTLWTMGTNTSSEPAAIARRQLVRMACALGAVASSVTMLLATVLPRLV